MPPSSMVFITYKTCAVGNHAYGCVPSSSRKATPATGSTYLFQFNPFSVPETRLALMLCCGMFPECSLVLASMVVGFGSTDCKPASEHVTCR